MKTINPKLIIALALVGFIAILVVSYFASKQIPPYIRG
jgi:hypothetical protein